MENIHTVYIDINKLHFIFKFRNQKPTTKYISLHISTLHTSHSTLHTPNSRHYTLHPTLHTLHSTLHTPHFTLHTLLCTLYIPHFTLHFTLHTLHFTLYTPHSTLCTPLSSIFHSLRCIGMVTGEKCVSMCFDICAINIRVSIRVCGLHVVFLQGIVPVFFWSNIWVIPRKPSQIGHPHFVQQPSTNDNIIR